MEGNRCAISTKKFATQMVKITPAVFTFDYHKCIHYSVVYCTEDSNYFFDYYACKRP